MNEYTYRALRIYAMEPLRQYLDTPAIRANDLLRRAMHGDTWRLKRDIDEAMELLKCTDLTPGEFAAAHLLAVISNARAIAWWREADAPGERQPPLSTSEQKALEAETRQAVAQFVAHVPEAQRAALLALIDNIAPQATDALPDTQAVALEPKAAPEWQELARNRAREIIKKYTARDLFLPQVRIAELIADEFRRDGVMGADGKPLTGTYIKRHAMKGISSAQGRQLSTAPRRGK